MATFYNLLTSSSAAESPNVIVSEPVKALAYYVGRNDISTVTYAVNQNFVGRFRIQGTLYQEPTETDWIDVKESIFNSVATIPAGTFTDPMTQLDLGAWTPVEELAAGTMLNSFSLPQITFDIPTSKMTLTLIDDGLTATSGKYITNQPRGYGRYTVIMKASATPGTVTEMTVGDITLQILGDAPNVLHASYVGSTLTAPVQALLSFDASGDFHTYIIDWQPGYILWYADNILVHTESSENGPIPSEPKVVEVSYWASINALTWSTDYVLATNTSTVDFDNVSFTPYITPATKNFSFKGNFTWVRAILDGYTDGAVSYARIGF